MAMLPLLLLYHRRRLILNTVHYQVHASAGAVKLLQAELLERKGTSDVIREGQMDARERLVKELEHSARRAQKVRILVSLPLGLFVTMSFFVWLLLSMFYDIM